MGLILVAVSVGGLLLRLCEGIVRSCRPGNAQITANRRIGSITVALIAASAHFIQPRRGQSPGNRIRRDAVGSQMHRLLGHLMGIFSHWNVGDESSLLAVEVDEDESGQHKDAGNSVASKGRLTAKGGHKHSSDNGATAPTKSMVKSLQNSLSGGAQVLWSVVSNVRATSGPASGVSYALHKFEGQNPPWIFQVGNVEESQDVAN